MRRAPLQILLVACVLTLLPRPAAAELIDWTGTGRGAWVTFSLNGDPLGNPFSDFAGELNWKYLPNGDSFFSYCVDATQFLMDPETVTVKSTNELTGASQSSATVTAGGGADAGKRIAWLFNTFATEAHNDVTGIFAAALQIAIWETLYDATPDVSGGSFRLVNNPAYANFAAISAKATSDLAALFSNAGTYFTSEATFLDTKLGQDQVTKSVPEPTTLLLLGSGVVAAFIRRRKSASVLAD